MKKILFAFLLILFLMCGCLSAQGDGETERRIQSFENGLAVLGQAPDAAKNSLAERMAFYKVPGVSIAVFDGNKIEWAKGYGVVRAGSGAAVTPDTLFEAASTTKALVAATVLHFVEKGRLDLDVDVNRYLKSWHIPTNEFTREKKVTLRLLLSHRAGLPLTNMGGDEKIGVPTLLQVIKGESPAQNKPAIPEIVPGSKWQYSNVGYVLIQLILEERLGKPLEQIMAEALFMPLAMKSSTLIYPLAEKLRGREALPHDKQGAAAAPVMHPTALAQGGLMTTPVDLARFAIGLMQIWGGKDTTLLSAKTVQAMFRVEVELDPRMFGTPLGEGLGVFVKGSGRDLLFAHPGNNYPGSICWLVGYPERGQGAAVMLNGAGGEMLAIEILGSLGAIYDWPPLL